MILIKSYKTYFFFTILIISAVSCEFLGFYEISNYFPVNIGNKWIYSFKYKPISWDDEEYIGELTWEIVDLKRDKNKEITIFETITATRITHDWNTQYRDSAEYSKEELINFKQQDDFTEVVKPNFFNRSFKFKSKFDSDEVYITVRNDYEHETSGNIISLDGEWDIIGLRKNVGIEQWTIRASHISGPSGFISLIDYRIIPGL